MEENQTLWEIHDRIKENPFRIDIEVYAERGTGYCNAHRELSDVFADVVRSGKYPQLKKAEKAWFMHDWNLAICLVRMAARHLAEGTGSRPREHYVALANKYMVILDAALNAVHMWLLTGEMECFYVQGKNETLVRCDWDEETQEYVRHEKGDEP